MQQTVTLADVMAELRVVRQLLERQVPPQLLPEQRDVVMALFAVFGTSAFTTSEAMRACALPIGDRPALRCALVALCGGLDVQKVGIALGAIVDAGGVAGSVRLTRPEKKERNSRLWCCEALRD